MNKFMKTYFALIMLLAVGLHYSQAQINFQKTFGTINNDYGNSIALTFDSAYILETIYNGAISVFKVNAHGDTIWQRSYPFLGSNFSNNMSQSIIQTADSNYVLIGKDSFVNCFFILKIDPIGDTLWLKRNTDSDASITGYAKVIEDNSGCLVIIGGIAIVYPTCCYPIMFKTDKDGNVMNSWVSPYDCPSSVGCRLSEIFIDNEGNFLLSGFTPSPSVPFSRLMKVKETGPAIWENYYTYMEIVKSITQTKDSGYLFVCSHDSPPVVDSTLLYKTDHYGNLEWVRKYKSDSITWQGNSIISVNDGYFISGSNGKTFIMKLDLSYNLIWSASFFDDSEERQMMATMDGGCIIIGSTRTNSAGGNDIYLIKIDPLPPNDTIVQTETFHVFPNPFTVQTTIQFDGFITDGTLTIYNSLGKQIKQITSISGKAVTFYRDNLPGGLYFFSLQQENREAIIEKIIIIDN